MTQVKMVTFPLGRERNALQCCRSTVWWFSPYHPYPETATKLASSTLRGRCARITHLYKHFSYKIHQALKTEVLIFCWFLSSFKRDIGFCQKLKSRRYQDSRDLPRGVLFCVWGRLCWLEWGCPGFSQHDGGGREEELPSGASLKPWVTTFVDWPVLIFCIHFRGGRTG